MYGSTKMANLPMSRRRRARLDQHAANQKKYRYSLLKKNAPNREAFGRAALNAILVLYDHACNQPANNGRELVELLHKMVIGNLEHVGFDREQCIIRFDQMADKVQGDRERWRNKRSWSAETRGQT